MGFLTCNCIINFLYLSSLRIENKKNYIYLIEVIKFF